MKTLFGLLLLLPACAGASEPSAALQNRAPLQPNAFLTLPVGAVRPKGWLLKQEQIQAAGLTGHLDEFWNDVGPNSGWLGGSGESWERGPYYLDGLLPLAYQLNDKTLIAKAKRWVDWSLQSQRADGQFGPAKNDDWWPRMVMLKVLTQYAEATGDARVEPFLTRYFHYELTNLPERPLRDWGKYRWQDNVWSVIWLYNRTGDGALLKLARLLHEQGYDWEAQYENFRYTSKETKEKLGLKGSGPIPEAAMQTHGVNNAMALKAAPVRWLLSGSARDRSGLDRQMAELDRYHGLPNGMFSGDEHLAGRDPSQGIELCAVVESMFSLETSLAILGEASLGDRLERVSYNALPATLSNDMWSHQYDQQPNQIACTRAHRQWSTNGDDSNLFGLAPNFGCCTANLHQGWPKFVTNLWMADPAGGLVAAEYGPSEVRTTVKGQAVTVDEQTEYPFQGAVHLVVHAKARFPIWLRLPEWAQGAAVRINGKRGADIERPTLDKGFYKLTRAWKDGETLDLSFSMKPRVTHWYHDAAVFERGPLVFSLPLDGEWRELKKYAEGSGDWQITPQAAWNYAVQTGECDSRASESALSSTPFDREHPGVWLMVKARRLTEWQAMENSAGPVPLSPVRSTAPLQTLKLIPYGAAKLRMTAFPYLQERSSCRSSEDQRATSSTASWLKRDSAVR